MLPDLASPDVFHQERLTEFEVVVGRDRRTGVERYVADGSGSLVGLVTFGDETIGALEVIPDSASAAQPMWEVWSERMPPMGSRVQVRITGLPK